MNEVLHPQLALNSYPYPLVIITAGDEKENAGMTAVWVTQVSWRPPYIGVAIYNKWTTLKLILKHKKFAVNLVSKKLVKVALRVFGGMSSKKVNKFKVASKDYGVEIIKGKAINTPVIADSPIVIECNLLKHIEIGDHYLIVGDPILAYRNNKDPPVLYYMNKFYAIGEEIAPTG